MTNFSKLFKPFNAWGSISGTDEICKVLIFGKFLKAFAGTRSVFETRNSSTLL